MVDSCSYFSGRDEVLLLLYKFAVFTILHSRTFF